MTRAGAYALAAALAAAFPSTFRDEATAEIWAQRIDKWPLEIATEAVDWLIDNIDRPTVRLFRDRCRGLLEDRRIRELPADVEPSDEEREQLRQRMPLDIARLKAESAQRRAGELEQEAQQREVARSKEIDELFPCGIHGCKLETTLREIMKGDHVHDTGKEAAAK